MMGTYLRLICVLLIGLVLALGCADDQPTAPAASDDQAPGTIKTLSFEYLDSTSIMLRWWSTGDDGGEGTAAAYDLRMATESLTVDNFFTADSLPIHHPPEGGHRDSLQLDSLPAEPVLFFSLRVRDDAGNWSDLSNPIVVQLIDSVGPMAVTDLQVTSYDGSRVTVQWTAPYDSSYLATVAEYQLRRDTVPVTDLTWDDAEVVPFSLEPALPGESQSTQLYPLGGRDSTWIALRSIDHRGNSSAVSNQTVIDLVDTLRPVRPAVGLVSVEAAAEPGLPSTVHLRWQQSPDPAPYQAVLRPVSYELRRSTSEITDLQWNASTLVDSAIVSTVPIGDFVMYDVEMPVSWGSGSYYFAIRSQDRYGNASLVSYNCLATFPNDPGDELPPTTITDLFVTVAWQDSVRLNWTAPWVRDQGSSEIATYEIAFGLFPIQSETDWAAADRTTIPATAASGYAEEYVLTGLRNTGTYYFAVRAVDDQGLRSGLSNTPWAVMSGDATQEWVLSFADRDDFAIIRVAAAPFDRTVLAARQINSSGDWDWVIMMIEADGSIAWERDIPASGDNYPLAVLVNSANEIAVGGRRANDPPTANGIDLAWFDLDGELLREKHIPGYDGYFVKDIAFSAGGITMVSASFGDTTHLMVLNQQLLPEWQLFDNTRSSRCSEFVEGPFINEIAIPAPGVYAYSGQKWYVGGGLNPCEFNDPFAIFGVSSLADGSGLAGAGVNDVAAHNLCPISDDDPVTARYAVTGSLWPLHIVDMDDPSVAITRWNFPILYSLAARSGPRFLASTRDETTIIAFDDMGLEANRHTVFPGRAGRINSMVETRDGGIVGVGYYIDEFGTSVGFVFRLPFTF